LPVKREKGKGRREKGGAWRNSTNGSAFEGGRGGRGQITDVDRVSDSLFYLGFVRVITNVTDRKNKLDRKTVKC
jgi:hypothetical protein